MSYHKPIPPYSGRRFFHSRRTPTKDTIQEAHRLLEKLLGENPKVLPSDSLKKHLIKEIENNLNSFSQITLLTPDIALWAYTYRHCQSRDQSHCVTVYCHGLTDLVYSLRQSWHERNGQVSNKSIKKCASPRYTESDDQIHVEVCVQRKDPSLQDLDLTSMFNKSEFPRPS